jgi:hypothetical protein
MDHESKTANPYLPALEDAIGYSLQTQFRPVQITNDHGGSLTLLFLKDEGSWIPIQEETNVLQLLLSSTPIPIQEVEQQTELFRSSVSMDLNKPTIIARDKVHFTNIDIRNEFIAAALGRNLVGNNDLQWEARFVAHAYDERDTIQLRGRSDLQERSIAPSARSAQGHEDARMGGTTPPPPSELSQMSAPTRPPTGNVHSAAGHARPHSSERGGSKSKRGRFD